MSPQTLSPQTLLLIWLAFLGGCIGSFLNVVVYRLPRAQSLAYPGSRCPACGHAIRWRHNIPVLGWLTLRGKCFDCQANIAIRYPLVEALVAAMFVVLAMRGPLAVADLVPELEAYRTSWEIACWGLYGYFLLGSTMLLALALMDIDSRREAVKQLPWKPVLALLVCGLVIPWLWLPLKLNPRGEILSGRAAINFLSAHAISSNLSFAILLLPATLFWQSVTSLKLSKDRVWLSGASVLLIAAYFGYFGTLEIVASATGLFFFAKLLGRMVPELAKIPFSAMLFVATFGWLLTPRPGSHYLPESSHLSESNHVADSVTYEILGVALFVVWATALLIRRRKMMSTKPLT